MLDKSLDEEEKKLADLLILHNVDTIVDNSQFQHQAIHEFIREIQIIHIKNEIKAVTVSEDGYSYKSERWQKLISQLKSLQAG